jgi:hypothetical protein
VTGLLDEIRNEPRKLNHLCGIALIASKMPPVEAKDLKAALADTALQNATIAKVLTRRGYKVSDQTIGRHRNRKCACSE